METFVASELATSGSVIAKHDRILPSRSGCSHLSFCAAVPNRAIVSMFPVSGEVQFVAWAAISACTAVPMISHRSAYCKFVRPAPYRPSTRAAVSTGRKRFHKPWLFAFCMRSINSGGCVHSFVFE